MSIFTVMKNTQKVFLFLNGKPPKTLPDLSDYDFICATDGGYHTLQKSGIFPDLVTGDFDSSENHTAKEIVHTPDQNFTDFDKILQILHERGYQNIHVFGASGGEQDHFLGNLHTAILFKEKLNLTFFDDYGMYFLAKNEQKIENVKDKTVSLLPLPKATHIFTKGLQYPLTNETLDFGKRIGTRNKAIEETVEISHESGELFIFVND